MRNSLLKYWANIASQYPIILLGISTIVTGIFGYLASNNLSPSKGIGAMLSGDDPKFKSYMEILSKFPNETNIAVLVEGERSEMVNYLHTLNDTLSKRPDLVIDFNFVRTDEQIEINGLSNFDSDELVAYEKILFAESLGKALNYYIDDILVPMKDKLSTTDINRLSANISKLRMFLEDLVSFGNTFKKNSIKSKSIAKNLSDTFIIGSPYNISPDGSAILSFIEPAFNLGFDSNGNEIDQFEVIDRVNKITDIVNALAENSTVKAGTAGALAIGVDEQKALEKEEALMSVSTLLAIVLIFIVFFLSFRMLLSPIISIITVVIGIVWTIGLVSILFDNLILFSLTVLVAVFGLGVDFCIHIYSEYSSNFKLYESTKKGFESAIYKAFVKAGPGIVMGAVTTSIAFFSLSLSSSEMMSQMGVVAGSGIILELLAAFLILPGFLRILSIFSKNNSNSLSNKQSIKLFTISHVSVWARDNYRLTSFGIGIFTIIMLWMGSMMRYDYNMMNLEPKGMQSVENQEKIVSKFGIMTDYAMILIPKNEDGTTNIERLIKVNNELSNLETVGKVQSAASFIPESSLKTRMERNKNRLSRFKEKKVEENGYFLLQNIKDIQTVLFHIDSLLPIDTYNSYKVSSRLKKIIGSDGIIENLNEIYNRNDFDYNIFYDSINSLYMKRQGFIRDLVLSDLAIESSRINSISMIPPKLRKSYAVQDDPSVEGYTLVVRVFPSKDFYKDLNFFEKFVNEVESVSQSATGLPIVTYNMLDSFGSYGKVSMLFSMLIIFAFLAIDFRSFRMASIALSVLIFGTVWMVGLMYLLGMSFNIMSMMVIPLIIGIGIDDGIHILHRYNIDKSIKMSYGTTGKAILVTTLTTAIGFGSLSVSSFPALYDLGMTLMLGSISCYLATIFVVPVLLRRM